MPVEKLQLTTTLDQERINVLKQLFPEACADGKINFETLRDLLGETLEDDTPDAEHFGLFWPGKRAARRLAAQPSKGTLAPVSGEGIDEEKSENIFIEGENLEVLKLLQKSYTGKIKMIYIDPPYNTGNDFIYKDDYSEPLESYLRRTGQTDEEGNLLTSNTKADGRFHSNWLNMMYPRLRLARNLLSDDGVIFVSIDDNEVHNLRAVMNELFGEESFLAAFIWHRRQIPDGRNQDKASVDHEYVLAYKNELGSLRGIDIDTNRYTNPDNDPRGPWVSADLTGLATKDQRPNLHYEVVNPETGRVYPPLPTRGWAISKDNFQKLIEEKLILWPPKPDGRPRLKKFLKNISDFQTSFSSMLEAPFTTDGTREIQQLFGDKVFSFPKPTGLIKMLIKQAAADGGIVLDFFAGSSATAQALLELNSEDGASRNFICVQLPEDVNLGGAAFKEKYKTIADISKERIRKVINNHLNKGLNTKFQFEGKPKDEGFRTFKLSHSNFRLWHKYEQTDVGGLLLEMERKAQSPLIDGAKESDVFTEIALLEGFALSAKQRVSEVFTRNRVMCISDGFNAHKLHICIDKEIWEETVEQLQQLAKEDVFYCFDGALSDAAKIQLAECCRIVTI